MKKFKMFWGMLLVFVISLSFILLNSTFVSASEQPISVLKFKNANIKIVMQAIAQKAVKDGKKVNIVVSPGVEGLITISLENVDWLTALNAVLRPYDYGYEWVGQNIVLIDSLEKIREREIMEKERQTIEPPRTRVFNLKYIDANDAKTAIEPLLSAVGRISVLEQTGQAGWEFGTGEVSKRERSKEGRVSKAKQLIVSDISKKLDEIEILLGQIDLEPKLILIKAKILEVDRDTLKDIGFSWGTGTTGATGGSYVTAKKKDGNDLSQIIGNVIAPESSIFGSRATGLGSEDFHLGFRKLSGTEFEIILHALEEDVNTNTLSSPSILTLNNQEASILVGTQYPIIETKISTETNQIVGGSLKEYKDIGIQLNVIPQISGENQDLINMIIHPAISSTSENLSVTSGSDSLISYPIIVVREIETQIIIKDGETIVIGGLLKDVVSESEIGWPLLKDIPFLGRLFKRTTKDVEKIDLMIFITAKIVKPGEIMSQQIMRTNPITAAF